ncbi:MAG TPA: MaoC family dehydratase [Steroidobacteraceae bacterium]|nr:MaoC family dehydratase [Steroidobacteraceae bacterium]
MGEPCYLDDLTLGQRFSTASLTVTAADIQEFSRKFDPQPFHVDEDQAARTFFRGLAASGWHVAALTMRLIVDAAPFAGGVIGAGAEVEWPKPTRAGDVLRVESEIVEIIPSRSKPDRAIVRVRCVTLNQRNEVAQTLVAKLLVWKRPAVP